MICDGDFPKKTGLFAPNVWTFQLAILDSPDSGEAWKDQGAIWWGSWGG